MGTSRLNDAESASFGKRPAFSKRPVDDCSRTANVSCAVLVAVFVAMLALVLVIAYMLYVR